MRFYIIICCLCFRFCVFAQSQSLSERVLNERDTLSHTELESMAGGSELFFVFVCDDDIYWDCRMSVLDSLAAKERYDVKYKAVRLKRSSSGRKNQIVFGERAEPNTFFVYCRHRAVAITLDQTFLPLKNYSNWYSIDLGVCETDECLKFKKNIVGRIDQLKKRYKEIFHAIEINAMVASCLTKMDSLEGEVETLKLQLEERPELLVGLNVGISIAPGKYSLIGDYTSGHVNVDITRRPELGLEFISLRKSSWEKLKFYFSGGICLARSDISFQGDSLLFVINDSSLDASFTRYRAKKITEKYYLKSYSLPLIIGSHVNIGKNSSVLFGLGLRYSKSYAGGFSEYSYQENNFILNRNSSLILENIPSLGLTSYVSNSPSYSFTPISRYSYLANIQYLYNMKKYYFAVSLNYERNATFLGTKSLSSFSHDNSVEFYTPDFESRIKQCIALQVKFGLNINK